MRLISETVQMKMVFHRDADMIKLKAVIKEDGITQKVTIELDGEIVNIETMVTSFVDLLRGLSYLESQITDYIDIHGRLNKLKSWGLSDE